ncbi:MAG: efflux RND transporter periplasmic adaptor subunit, partial [Cyclobacteriaceae bacterium]|nr:efflux RND transporter periplasmic adaptor subunit [Cyclobacteriaceae bacterium]
FNTAGINFGQIEEKQISGTIKVNGLLDVPPQQLANVSVPLGGFLKNSELLQGTRVKKGHRIATIENIEFVQLQQDYLEARNQLEYAKADFERQQELAKENVNAKKTLQFAKANYYNWQAKSKGFQEKLKMLNINFGALEAGNISSSIPIYAPISGYVTEVNVNIGKYVNPSDVLFEIVDTNHLHAELIVFEKDVPKLKIGQKVRFTLANESTERMATIFLIGRKISTNRTIRIHCHIDKEDTQLLPGMYLKALVEAGGALVQALPDEAIIDYQGKKYIFVNTNGNAPNEGYQFRMIEIEVGSSELGYTEVMLPDDYEKDLKVVTKGAYAILSMMKNSEEEGH